MASRRRMLRAAQIPVERRGNGRKQWTAGREDRPKRRGGHRMVHRRRQPRPQTRI